MYVFILDNNSTNRMHFHLCEVMNAGSDSDAQKFDNRKFSFFEFEY